MIEWVTVLGSVIVFFLAMGAIAYYLATTVLLDYYRSGMGWAQDLIWRSAW